VISVIYIMGLYRSAATIFKVGHEVCERSEQNFFDPHSFLTWDTRKLVVTLSAGISMIKKPF
jgi:hypothetical protein